MEVFGQVSDRYPLISSSVSMERQETSSLSDSSNGGHTSSVQSDPEVLLATSRPKKRAGRRIFKETRHPVFRGVRRRNGNKWVCELREPNKNSRIWLGTYPTPEMAARAHDVAALALRGKSACLNFSDSHWRLPVPASTDARDIRRAAIEAAELFRPEEFGGKARKKDAVEDSSEACSDECKDWKKIDLTFMDEEAELEMPKLLTEMAAGLLLSPPHYSSGSVGWDDVECHADFSLWSY